MENNITQLDFKDIQTYKTKKFINILKKLTDDQINIIIDTSVIEFISNLDSYTINLIFRNSNATMQNKLWSSDIIQKVIIMGTIKSNNLDCNKQTIRNLENLSKVIKSPIIKKQIYNNKYFISVVIKSSKIENRFFNSYDLSEVFNGLIQSEEFNSMPSDAQLRIIEKLNSYTKEILLPKDFRRRFNNIERILFDSNRDKIDSSIMDQLNSDELFFLDYLNDSIDNNNAIRDNLLTIVKINGKSFEEFFDNLKTRDDLIKYKIQTQFNCQYFNSRVSLEEKVYHILLNENQDELIKEKLLKYLI